MSFGKTKSAFVLIALVAALLGSVLAAEPSGENTGLSKEQRAQMAAVHEKMAACLRSDRPLEECRDEMHASCVGLFGDEGCPMGGVWLRDRPIKRPPPERLDTR